MDVIGHDEGPIYRQCPLINLHPMPGQRARESDTFLRCPLVGFWPEAECLLPSDTDMMHVLQEYQLIFFTNILKPHRVKTP